MLYSTIAMFLLDKMWKLISNLSVLSRLMNKLEQHLTDVTVWTLSAGGMTATLEFHTTTWNVHPHAESESINNIQMPWYWVGKQLEPSPR